MDHHADLHQRPFFRAHVSQPPHKDESQSWQDNRKRKSEKRGDVTMDEITKRKETAYCKCEKAQAEKQDHPFLCYTDQQFNSLHSCEASISSQIPLPKAPCDEKHSFGLCRPKGAHQVECLGRIQDTTAKSAFMKFSGNVIVALLRNAPLEGAMRRPCWSILRAKVRSAWPSGGLPRRARSGCRGLAVAPP